MKRRLLLAWLLTGMGYTLQAQLTVADTLTKSQLLQTLFGGGVIVSNLQVNCDTTVAMWEFDGTNSNIGLSRGVLMSTGEAADAVPTAATACNNVLSTDNNAPGYGPLGALIPGFTTQDACVITFDILPYCDTIGIRYVFASEEYPEWVNSNFNDVFAFFISGPGFGPPPGQNIALVPGTTIPVSIDNVNNGTAVNCNTPTGPCVNCAFYVDNAQGTTLAYDAFTTPLLAEAVVQPCQLYTVTLAIADAGDPFLDSGVFLEAGGIGCTSTVLALNASNNTVLGNNLAIEDCVDGSFSFSILAPLTDTVVFHYTIGGTATPGLDYSPIPDSIVMLPGQTVVTLPVTIYNDLLLEGMETIEIIYTDSALCASQVYADTAILQIMDPPTVYQPSNKSICSDDTISIGVPTLPGYDYIWSPVAGLSNPNIANPTLSLTNASSVPQVFQYILTTTILQGICEYIDTIEVTVHPANQADFVADTVCYGWGMGFVDLTYADTIIAWDWDFGDGNAATVQHPTHTYGLPGVYQVELITLNGSGCPDTVSYPVLVDSLPIVNYTVSPVCDGVPVQFNHLVGPGVDYQWDFGDGNGATLSLPGHQYGTFGNYPSRLIATTAQGCVDSSSQVVEVYQNPVAAYSVEDICLGFDASFVNQTLAGSGPQLSYLWGFGDGSPPSSQTNPSHAYATFGTYAVTLAVTDNHGCADFFVDSVEIFPAVEAQFNYDPVCFGDTTPFRDQSVFVASGPIDSWLWQFGDGGQSGLQSPTHRYNSYGTYTVQLHITSIHGCTDSISKTIAVYDQPIAAFAYESDCEEQAIPFQNLSLYHNANLSWGWDFDDGGNASNQKNPLYTFSSHGAYQVALTVTTNEGCSDTYRLPVEIWPLPVAQFHQDPVCQGAEFQLDNESYVPGTGVLDKYLWDLGDGRRVGGADLTGAYHVPGSYALSLWIQTQQGCADSLTQQVDVYPLPKVDFHYVNACTDTPLSFENRSSIVSNLFHDQLENWTWNWGDGSAPTGAIPNPQHRYQQAGTYPVTLTVQSDKGCESSRTFAVTSWPLPPVPVIVNDTVCWGDQALLVASGVPPTERIDWYTEPSGGNAFHTGGAYVTPPIVSPTQYYLEPVTDSECRDGRYPITVSLHNPGSGSLVVSDSIVETPQARVDFSVAGTLEGSLFQWHFGDGSQSALPAPTHEYQYPGRYAVWVKVSDRFGCETLLESIVEVKEYITLYVPSGFSPNGDGINDQWYIGHKLLTQFQVKVFNRWGQEVYTSDQPDFQWNGLDQNGQLLPEGVYAFMVQALDIHGNLVEKAGTITLFR